MEFWSGGMAIIDTNTLAVIERKPGWRGRYFDSLNMTFALYEFDAGSVIPAHDHPQEEVWNVIEGVLEITIDGKAERAGPGVASVVPPDTLHAVRAITDGKVIVTDYPLRAMS
jgi:quercetin dioxygenase-like cupin family protein